MLAVEEVVATNIAYEMNLCGELVQRWLQTDLSVHSQAKLNAVARQMNERPRKTLNYETPAEQFSQCVASIG